MMQQVVSKLGRFLLFFIPVLVIVQIIGFINLRKQEQLIEKKIQELSSKPILFMGASHIAFGISDTFSRVINVAARSEPYVFTLKKLQLLQPKIAIIGLNALNTQQNSNNAFEDGLMSLPQYRYLFNYLSGEEKEDIFTLTDFETEAFFFAKKWLPFLGSRLKKEPDSLIFGGWENWQAVSTTDQFLLERRYYNEFERYRFQLSDFQIKYLEKILLYAQQQQIQVVFLATPLHPQFIRLIPPQPFNDLENLLSQLQSKYSFTYYDFTRFPLPENYFYDADHLNGLGASEFTKVVSDRLEKEGIVGN
jgi:hypothetical protein